MTSLISLINKIINPNKSNGCVLQVASNATMYDYISDINIVDNTITASKLKTGSITPNLLANRSVTLDKLDSSTSSAGSFLVSTGATSAPNWALNITVPIGCVMMWPVINIPSGWLECNGNAVDQTMYPALYSMMANLPDLRGVFVRGLDNNRGYDTGRVLGSVQTDSFASHIHNVGSNGAHVHYTSLTASSGDGTFGASPTAYTPSIYGTPTTNTLTVSATSSNGAHTHTLDSSGGSETRPKNVAMLYIIKAL